uniref:Uncharacterized protein n=1 Tax=Setaria viridis TaxID=4556 RepID=A0A4U6TY81_SETVI|nr:hypothetical protein SEVIR_8G262066v2 [Setaria viridis]
MDGLLLISSRSSAASCEGDHCLVGVTSVCYQGLRRLDPRRILRILISGDLIVVIAIVFQHTNCRNFT